MEFKSMIPELTVSDINQTKNFYIGKLGFNLEYERIEDNFIFLSYGESKFMFEQIHEDGLNVGVLEYPFGRGINFSIPCPNIDELYQRAISNNINLYRYLKEAVYRCGENEEREKQFLIQDPDCYLLRFTD